MNMIDAHNDAAIALLQLSNQENHRKQTCFSIDRVFESCQSMTPQRCHAYLKQHPRVLEHLIAFGEQNAQRCVLKALLQKFYPYLDDFHRNSVAYKAYFVLTVLAGANPPQPAGAVEKAAQSALSATNEMSVGCVLDESNFTYYWNCFDLSWSLTVRTNTVAVRVTDERIRVTGSGSFNRDEVIAAQSAVVMFLDEQSGEGVFRDAVVTGNEAIDSDGRRVLRLLFRRDRDAHRIHVVDIAIDEVLHSQPSIESMFCGLRLDEEGPAQRQRLIDGVWRLPTIELDNGDDNCGSLMLGRYFVTLLGPHRAAYVDFDRNSVQYQEFEHEVMLEGCSQNVVGKFYTPSARIVRRKRRGRKRRGSSAQRKVFYPYFAD